VSTLNRFLALNYNIDYINEYCIVSDPLQNTVKIEQPILQFNFRVIHLVMHVKLSGFKTGQFYSADSHPLTIPFPRFIKAGSSLAWQSFF
jgi:hypothetical protein